jgi:hypothetical protein
MKWLIGIAAGAAVIYLLKSGKGKELLATVNDKACDLTKSVKDLFGEGLTAVKTATEKA